MLALRQQLSVYERSGLIASFTDYALKAGDPIEDRIRTEIESAQIIVLLVSSAFLASEFIDRVELADALTRHHAGKVRLIPVIARPSPWQETEFANLRALPRTGRPIDSHGNRQAALLEVALGIAEVAREIL
jgi:hypothetical protein